VPAAQCSYNANKCCRPAVSLVWPRQFRRYGDLCPGQELIKVIAEDLIRIIYASSATTPIELRDLLSLLDAARSHNLSLGVTGLLVYEDGCFLQVIEGRPEAVRSLFAQIAADKRHGNVTKLVEEAIETPIFGDWSMGFVRVARVDLLNIPVCNGFFASGGRLEDIDESRARIVLEKFREAMWHKKAG
jgi:hypothetical protein